MIVLRVSPQYVEINIDDFDEYKYKKLFVSTYRLYCTVYTM